MIYPFMHILKLNSKIEKIFSNLPFLGFFGLKIEKMIQNDLFFEKKNRKKDGKNRKKSEKIWKKSEKIRKKFKKV